MSPDALSTSSAAPKPIAIDEMVDGRGGVRPHWRALLGIFSGLDHGGLAERRRRLDRAFEDEGIGAVLPGADTTSWRCDPVPLPIPAQEFAQLEAGLAQRARLLDSILADLYGPQTLLSEGLIPPALVFANPGFLRPCHSPGSPRSGSSGRLHFYAADLVRGPDGEWRVLADRTSAGSGIGYARENRRLLANVLPELFRPMQVRQLRPFFDVWQDALLAHVPPGPRPATPSVALLTPGTSHPQWFEHMFLSRELSCALVESGDLTVRGGAVYLKTLRGLQPIDVLLRRMDGRLMDPLELDGSSRIGVPGLLDAARGGGVRIVNDAGTGAAEAPALAAFLPALSMRLLGEKLALPSVPTLWLGEERARGLVQQDLSRWLIRPATDGAAHGVSASELSEAGRLRLAEEIALRPWSYAASTALPPSVAPCLGEGEGLQPRPLILRLFLVFDGRSWQAMQGGLARVLDADNLAGNLPKQAISKDVWVISDEGREIVGPPIAPAPRLKIRRVTGDLPSRVADDFFWLGRYTERLDGAARLTRAMLNRISRGLPLPHEVAELHALAACMEHLNLLDSASGGGAGVDTLRSALRAAMRQGGAIESPVESIGRLIEALRDRLTGEMYGAFRRGLREARVQIRAAGEGDGRRASVTRPTDDIVVATTRLLGFSTVVAGVAAENMVRGGGFLFLDMGRRIERAQTLAAKIAFALDQPAARIESGLRLTLELCDSAITYRHRYLTVLQPGPVLDLVLADESNPRALAFQLEAIRTLLDDVGGGSLGEVAGALLVRVRAILTRVVEAENQAAEAVLVPQALGEIEAATVQLSARIARRYFALLPAAQALGHAEPDDAPMRGAA